MTNERPPVANVGGPHDFADDDGEEVTDEELMGTEEPSSHNTDVPQRFSVPRISQRMPRVSVGGGVANEGDILVGRYRVERVLARTQHEVVLEASHLDLGQRVLLRHLSPLASTSPEAVARFQRGAKKAREMRSEHAERVVDFGRLDSGAPYRAVELPRGPSLAEVMRVRGALPVSEAVDIIVSACEPVAEAHASGVIHRSLSTSNIFIERRPDGAPLVRVLDFGVSDPLEPDWINGDELAVPGAGASVEALRFASPEQIRNPAAVDARADVWSLGAVLYELIAGGPLFHADSPLTLLAMIAADTPTPLGLLRTDVPPELEQFVLSCLEKDPGARPPSVVDIVLTLAPYASPDAQPAAARIARIVMRTTRPPPMPSQRPLSSAARTSALVRSYPPPQASAEPSRSRRADARGFGMLFAGAGIGLGAALIAAQLVRPAAPSFDARAAAPLLLPQAAAPAALPAGIPPSAAPLVVAPVGPALPNAGVVGPVLATAAPAPVKAQRGAPQSPAAAARPTTTPATAPPAPAEPPRLASAARSSSDSRAAARTASAPTDSVATAQSSDAAVTKKKASADDLFGGMD